MSEFELWTPRPFPIRDEDVLVVASVAPGRALNLTSWQLRIADNGLLVQHVDVWEPRKETRFEEHIAELPGGFCNDLHHKMIKIGFESFPEYYYGWDDLPTWTIRFRMADGTRKKVMIVCDPHRTGQAAIEEGLFFELWEMIHLYAPFKMPEAEPTRSKRQIRLDARRQRKQNKKQGPSESGPIEDQEGK